MYYLLNLFCGTLENVLSNQINCNFYFMKSNVVMLSSLHIESLLSYFADKEKMEEL